MESSLAFQEDYRVAATCKLPQTMSHFLNLSCHYDVDGESYLHSHLGFANPHEEKISLFARFAKGRFLKVTLPLVKIWN